jgi:hypothetical protein
MIVKYRKAFFADLATINRLDSIDNIEFVTECANKEINPVDIPGFKWLRQYPGIARVECVPYRIGVEVIGDTIIFKRVLDRSVFYLQFP